MNKPTMTDLVEDKTVRQVTNGSILQVLEKLCYASIKTEDRMRKVAESFETLLQLYKNSNVHSLTIEKQPVEELKNFWETVSSVSAHDFNDLERETLATDRGAPFVFLGSLLNIAYENGKNGLAQKFLEPLYKKAKEL